MGPGALTPTLAGLLAPGKEHNTIMPYGCIDTSVSRVTSIQYKGDSDTHVSRTTTL